MMAGHPAFQQLRAYALADNGGEGRAALRRHLGECTTCRDAVAFVRTVVSVTRDNLAPSAPPADAMLPAILARIDAGARVILPAAEDTTRQPRRRPLAIALGLTVAVASVAAALPGSPLHQWIAGMMRNELSPAPVADTVSPAVGRVEATGVAIAVSAGEMWVAIDSAPPALRIRVRLTDGTTLDVRGIGAAASASYSPRINGIGVSGAVAGEIEVNVPRSASRFVLRVAGRPYVVREGDQMRVMTPADSVGAELLFGSGQSRP